MAKEAGIGFIVLSVSPTEGGAEKSAAPSPRLGQAARKAIVAVSSIRCIVPKNSGGGSIIYFKELSPDEEGSHLEVEDSIESIVTNLSYFEC